MALEVLQTTCCVVGGGPAGIMLGYLLARKGVQVAVLEKHQDFFRDFRGDTVHPSTLEVLNELGLLEEFLDLPHEKVESLGVIVGDSLFEVADFRHVPVTCKFVALMPQWDFLNFLSAKAKGFPSFQLLTQHEATDLVRDGERITGVVVQNEGREMRIRADLVVGCDGRHSLARKAAELEVVEHGVPIDVLWFRISRTAGDSSQVLGNVNYGKALILINRSDYFQAGLIIAKGSMTRSKPAASMYSGRHSQDRAVPGRTSERTSRLGADQDPDSADQSASTMVSAGPAVHWRCRPCHVARGWSGN